MKEPFITQLVQLGLKAHGHDPGPIDGIRGPKTRDAYAAYVASVGGKSDVGGATSLPARVRTYSLARDGAKQVTKNFLVREYRCKDGSDVILICDEVARLAQCVRDHFGRAVIFNSAYRTLSHNRSVGSPDTSFHVRGMAVDLRVPPNTAREVYLAIDRGRVAGIDPRRIGLGLYRTFVHIDSRGAHARWPGTGVTLP